MKIKKLPPVNGVRMVAEREPQQDAYMIWPERPDNWRDGAKPAQHAFAKLANLIGKFEPITMFVSSKQYLNARHLLNDTVRVLEMSSDDAFIKDTGPIYIDVAGQLRGVAFGFNAWGGLLDGLYFPWDQDQLIASKLAELNYVPYYDERNLNVEGCSIITDGQGTLITTEDVLLSEGRNAGQSKEEIETVLKRYLGVSQIIWLQHGFFLDETNGAIDNMMNFIAPGEVVLTWTDDKQDPMYETVRQAEAILNRSKDARGHQLKVHHLRMPAVQTVTKTETESIDPINGLLPRTAGQRLTTSYVNYVLVNGAVIVPQFDDHNDADAVSQLKALFVDRQVIPFNAREMVLGGGGLHTVVHTRPDATSFGGK
ncbi:MAG TPA: agmatine deiminase [Lactobacillus sp.]|nr:agmatine deiminase [Lactobacillus sp.]